MSRTQPPEPVNMTLFGRKVFVDWLHWGSWDSFILDYPSGDNPVIKWRWEREDIDVEEKAENADSHQELEEMRTDCPMEP